MKEAPIRLFKHSKMEDGTIRLQSQLMVGRDSVDFIFQDGILKVWEHRKEGGLNFHETDIPYKIVDNKKDMLIQQL